MLKTIKFWAIAIPVGFVGLILLGWLSDIYLKQSAREEAERIRAQRERQAEQQSQMQEQQNSQPQSTPVEQPSPVAAWDSGLPPEDAELRAKYEANGAIAGWLSFQNVRFVTIAYDELLDAGYFVNQGYAHNGAGWQRTENPKASCVSLGVDQYICGVGAGGTWQWGIQTEGVQDAFKSLK